jgi:hypothetical protein
MDTEWTAANKVMPGAWRVRDVTDLFIGGPPNNHAATAVSIGRLPAGTLTAYGNSPDDALAALHLRLIEKRDGHEETAPEREARTDG